MPVGVCSLGAWLFAEAGLSVGLRLRGSPLCEQFAFNVFGLLPYWPWMRVTCKTLVCKAHCPVSAELFDVAHPWRSTRARRPSSIMPCRVRRRGLWARSFTAAVQIDPSFQAC